MLKIIEGVKVPPITTLHFHSDKEAVEVAFALTSKRDIYRGGSVPVHTSGGHP